MEMDEEGYQVVGAVQQHAGIQRPGVLTQVDQDY